MPFPSVLKSINWKTKLMVLWEFPCMLPVVFVLLPLKFSFSIFTFFYFNYNMTQCGIFEFILSGTLCTSFPRLGRFSTIISSNKFSALFSLLPSGTPIMWVLVCWMLPQWSLKLSSFFKNILSFILFSLDYFYYSSLSSSLSIHSLDSII